MLSARKSLIGIALSVATLTACGGGGSGSDETATTTTVTTPSAQAAINTTNAQVLSQATIGSGSLGTSSLNLVRQFENQLTSSAQGRQSDLAGSDACPLSGDLVYAMTNEGKKASFTFNSCKMNADMALNGKFSFDLMEGSSTAIAIAYDAFNLKMAPSSLNNYQAFDDTLQGKFSILMDGQGDSFFTIKQDLVRTKNQTGISITSKTVSLTYSGNSMLPTAASGTVVHSLEGAVSLSVVEEALILSGDNSKLKIEQQGGSYLLSLDEDNDGIYDQQSSATQFAGEELVWTAI
ncbi:hypothetical protein [Motilimonas cestriensis]|uniref:hypothetical protein n=1 Tax=Motilimonas cestriensis TaxID=2742685 RepID=UPI003DA6A962